ncbi:MAG: ATP-binding protein [SAR324 cluster bacterium]|nr:ATP-binding protein [SAR324 cluster bacterium]
MQSRKVLSYWYAAIFLLVVFFILMGNYIYLTEETESKLNRIFWKQSEVISETIALSARHSVQSLRLEPEHLSYFAKNLAEKIEAVPELWQEGGQKRLEEILKKNDIESILILNARGHVVLQAPQIQPQSMAGPIFEQGFKGKSGGVMISLGNSKIFDLKTRYALQELTSQIKNRELVEYASFYNHNLIVVASTDPNNIGKRTQRKDIEDSLKSKASYFPPSDKYLEVIHYFPLSEGFFGVFHVGLSLGEMQKASADFRHNTLVGSAWVMGLLVLVVILVLRFQSFYLRRLDKMQVELREQERMVSLGNMAAGVAHEIRNPLNSISITIQRLQIEFEPPKASDAEEFNSFLDLMKKEANRLNQIVTDFLGFSKPFAPRSEVFSITEFLKESLLLITEEAKERGLELLWKEPTAVGNYYGDAEKLKQVILNLLGNAMDACREGGKVEVRSSLDKKGLWRIDIIDQGEGIAPEKLAHLFDIYYTTKAHGTGLGLYISRKIIQAHDGTIELKNNPIAGVTCTIILPKRQNTANDK